MDCIAAEPPRQIVGLDEMDGNARGFDLGLETLGCGLSRIKTEKRPVLVAQRFENGMKAVESGDIGVRAAKRRRTVSRRVAMLVRRRRGAALRLAAAVFSLVPVALFQARASCAKKSRITTRRGQGSLAARAKIIAALYPSRCEGQGRLLKGNFVASPDRGSERNHPFPRWG